MCIMVGNGSSAVIGVGARLSYDPFYAHYLLPKYLLTYKASRFIKLFQWSNTNSSTQAPKNYDSEKSSNVRMPELSFSFGQLPPERMEPIRPTSFLLFIMRTKSILLEE